MSQDTENVLIFAALLCFILLSAFVGCVSVPQSYPRGDLAHQILHVRTGLGLSSRTVVDVVRYDLADQGMRKQFGDLGFVCKLGGRRFEVCPDQPGFCRYTYSGFWPFRSQHVEYVAQVEEQRLVQAGTVCFSKRVYDYDSIN